MTKMWFFSVIPLILPFIRLIHASPTSQYSCAQAIKTSNGAITGHASKNASSVCEYLGIPYAQPPIGELRFAAPLKYNGSGAYLAANYGADCPQSTSAPYTFPNQTAQEPRIITNFANTDSGNPQSEDCLTLNVWSKQTPGSQLKPVIVFFYGGSEYSQLHHTFIFN